MKKLLALPIVFALFFSTTVFAAPLYIYQKSIIPEIDSTYELGTTTKAWLKGYFDEICLTADTCKTAWPTGGGSGGDSTLFNLSNNVIDTDGSSTTATTTIRSAGFFATSTTIASNFRLLTATSATTTNFQTTQFGVGSDYITDLTGTGLSIAGGALTVTNDHSAVTLAGARDYITLVGQDIVRGVVDVSDDTNLSADGTEIVLTGDALSLGTALTFTNGTSSTSFQSALGLFTTSSSTNASTTRLSVYANAYLHSLSDGCLNVTSGLIGSTGSACGSGAGGGSNWTYNGSRLTPSTTVGIGIFASSTIGGGTGATGLTVNGSGTTTATGTIDTLIVRNVSSAAPTATSTVFFYSAVAGIGGQIILEDSDAAGCTGITALNGVLSATTVTCPTEQ